MPRIPPTLFHRLPTSTFKLSRLLLPTCRTLEQTSNELRWIQTELPSTKWSTACVLRSRKVPLQYILGTQPFGSIDVKCRPGVLIPRWETEEYTVKIIDMIRYIEGVRSVVDVCTGSGCVPLLIGSELPQLKVKGIDVSEHALRLSEENKQSLAVDNVSFTYGDVFQNDVLKGEKYDIVISNPPYIPLTDYISNEVEPSVRKYEPKLALVGDLEFYKALVENVIIPSECKAFVLELGYMDQVQYTENLLDLQNVWGTKCYFDSAGKVRCVVGWKRGTEYEIFKDL
ncbi:hypothetical protein WICPIJ_002143 [Wickerhamomyces pijperi]|uniref:peptide chain release factor N(5)-glutamine methyltransferase n=1 Tax=Wickerhamomyces pijperi TaxID=599730 RepID=A0A9P8QCD2_WICPI|nr:hypothetical protein WICPIJ_002143 [Wickerhamomyces pijperi]